MQTQDSSSQFSQETYCPATSRYETSVTGVLTLASVIVNLQLEQNYKLGYECFKKNMMCLSSVFKQILQESILSYNRSATFSFAKNPPSAEVGRKLKYKIIKKWVTG